MSGGSHNYVFRQIECELCGKMHDRELNELMEDIRDLAHDLEWFESADISCEDYLESVNKFKKKWFKEPRIKRLEKYMDEGLNELKEEFSRMIKGEISQGEIERLEKNV